MATTTIYPFGRSASIGGTGYILVTTLPTASASTMGNIYLVPQSGNQNIKDMYVTVVSGGSYVWTQMGSTTVNLDGYATEAWVEARDVDLTEAQYEALVNAGTVDPNKRYFVDEQ